MERDERRPLICEVHISFQSTRSAWSVTRGSGCVRALLGISIHTLRMERDGETLHVGDLVRVFQSTRSAWSVTFRHGQSSALPHHFNPHAPHGA